MSSQGTYFLLSVLKLILLHCMKRALFSLCRMSKTEVLITSYLVRHNSVCSTALPSAAVSFQLTQAKITRQCLSPQRSHFLTEVWQLLQTQWRRRPWVWRQVMQCLLWGKRRGAGENPSLPWLHRTGTRVLGLVFVLDWLCAKTACVFHRYPSSISCQL